MSDARSELAQIVVSSRTGARTLNNVRISVQAFLDSIRGEVAKEQIDRLRELKASGKQEGSDEVKLRLNGITFSGLFNGRMKLDNLAVYSRLCVFDIDKLSPPELERITRSLLDDVFVIAFWKSPSGLGLKGIIRFCFSQRFERFEADLYHRIGFRQLQQHFDKLHQATLDSSGSDITRLCFISSDSGLYLRESIADFAIQIVEPPQAAKKARNGRPPTAAGTQVPNLSVLDKKSASNPIGKNSRRDRFIMARAIRYLTKQGSSITYDHAHWVRVAFATAASFSYDLGEKYFLQLCRLDGAKHDETKSIKLLQHAYMYGRKSVSFATIRFFVSKVKEGGGELL